MVNMYISYFYVDSHFIRQQSDEKKPVLVTLSVSRLCTCDHCRYLGKLVLLHRWRKSWWGKLNRLRS